MTRYKLPDALGGAELNEYRHTDGGTEAPVGTVAFLVDGCIVAVARALLTEVRTPMAEPADGRTVQVQGDEERAWVFTRDDRDATYPSHTWYGAGDDDPKSWQEVCLLGNPVLLEPAPEPVDLPWSEGPVAVQFDPLGLGDGSPHKVVVNMRGAKGNITSIRARDMARALWTAADQAEARS